MTPTQKAAMLAALDALENERPYLAPAPNKVVAAIIALNEALAEPVVEPVRYLWEEWTFTGECMAWVEVCTTYDPRLDEYRELHQEVKDWDDSRRVRGFMTLYTSPPPPAEVPLLSDEEIDACDEAARTSFKQYKSKVRGQQIMPPDGFEWHFARAIEAAYRRKLGLK